MSGSNSYNIEFNGDIFTTHNTNLTLQLLNGINHLKVSTDLECQGAFEKQIYVTDDFLVYPNPFNDFINMYNGRQEEKVMVSVYSTYGQLIFSKTYANEGMEMRIDTDNLAAGIYMMTIQSETTTSTHKIVKK